MELHLHERLQLLRKRRGLTQVALAHQVGVKPSTIAAYEVGNIQEGIPIKRLKALAKALGVSVADLLGEESPRVSA